MSESQHRQRRHRQKSRFLRILRTYRFEIIWSAIVVVGVFLIFERLRIRSTLIGWLKRATTALFRGAGSLDEIVSAFLARTTLSDVIGFVLIVVALTAIVLRVRWRLLHSPTLTAVRCPRCGGDIHRTHRNKLDHLISLVVLVRRYRCGNAQCRWSGLRVGVGHGVSRAPMRKPA